MALNPERELAEARAHVDRDEPLAALKRLDRARRGFLRQADASGLDHVLVLAEVVPDGDERVRAERANLVYAVKQNLRQMSSRAAHERGESWVDPYPDLEQPRAHTVIRFSPRVKLAIAVGVLVAVLLLGGFVALLVIGADEGGGGGRDLAVRFRNDLPQEVVLTDCVGCDSDTADSFIREELEPGASVEESLPADDLVDAFTVENRSGKRLGCLPVRVHDAYARLTGKQDEVTVRVSQLTRCPGITVLPRPTGAD